MVPSPRKSSDATNVPEALRALLNGLIDYAGMFPPAKLSLENSIHQFVQYATSSNSWMLGKFVVPAERLEELRQVLWALPPDPSFTCGLSVLLGAEPLRDVEIIRAALGQTPLGTNDIGIDAVEFRPGSPAILAGMADILPKMLPVFCEIPVVDDATEWLSAIQQVGWFAKIRTGGLTPESFPSSAAVANCMVQCREHGVGFKATAGLHHPVRSEHPLTYETGSVCGVMHGFLNVFLGAALLEGGIPVSQLVEILDDDRADNFRFIGRFAHWRKLFVNDEDLMRTRRHFAISFGSCSFEEPIEDLKMLGLL